MKVIHNPQIICKWVDSQWILLEKDHTHVRRLNETAGVLWSLTKRPITVDSLARHIAKKYGIPKDQASTDVREFVDLYIREGLLKEVAETSGKAV